MHHCSKYLVERRFQRFEFDVRLRITPVLRGTHAFGRTLEISCSGMSAVTAAELTIGEILDLGFPMGEVTIRVRGVVRNRNGARYGMEFLTLTAEQRLQIHAALGAE
jgi:PilZ domain-containing protein